MDKGIVREVLERGKYEIVLEKRFKKYAWRFKLSNGTSVYCGDNEKVWTQGKAGVDVKRFLDLNLPSMSNNKVFIVYGHDTAAKDELVHMLHTWGIDALAIDALPTQGRTIIEQLEHYIPQTNYGVVLATPDDTACSKKNSTVMQCRARQNVVLELGMLLSKLGRSRVAILMKECENFEIPSDIDGILYIRFSNSVTEAENSLKRELNSHGYNI